MIPSLKRVVEATAKAKALAPDMLIDGEMQFDAAVVPEIGQKKFAGSKVAGHANVLVFPDLNCGNSIYKATERLAEPPRSGHLQRSVQTLRGRKPRLLHRRYRRHGGRLRRDRMGRVILFPCQTELGEERRTPERNPGPVSKTNHNQESEMKKIVLMLLLMCSAVFAFADGINWLDIGRKAKEESQKTGKPILMLFTGSDWCGYCIKMEKDAFSNRSSRNSFRTTSSCSRRISRADRNFSPELSPEPETSVRVQGPGLSHGHHHRCQGKAACPDRFPSRRCEHLHQCL